MAQLIKTQATQVARQQKPIDMLKAVIDAPTVQAQFKNALGDHKDAFVASLIDLFTGDKSLQSCKPQLVIAEALRAATLRLPLNKALGFSYIVVYNNSVKNEDGSWTKNPTPTFIPGYKGYIQLASIARSTPITSMRESWKWSISFPGRSLSTAIRNRIRS